MEEQEADEAQEETDGRYGALYGYVSETEDADAADDVDADAAAAAGGCGCSRRMRMQQEVTLIDEKMPETPAEFWQTIYTREPE